MKKRLFNAVALLLAAFLLGCSFKPSLGSNKPSGSLDLKIKGAFSKFKTQYVLADISTISVRVQASDSSIQRHDFALADLSGASASFQFNSLRTGQANVTAQIVASASNQIGYATASAMIQADQTIPVTLTVQLDPTYILPGQIGVDLAVEPSDEVLTN